MGKTHSAIEFAYRHRHDYKATLWANADTRETLITAFVALARRLDLPEQDEVEQTVIVEAVKSWFDQSTGWLLILDNADELKVVRDFLPSGGPGHILLATRDQAVNRIAECLLLDRMSPEVGARLLLRRAGLLSEDEAIDHTNSAYSGR